MVSLVDDVVWKLLLQYTFETATDTDNGDLNCTICKRLIIDAYQTYCGCAYCYVCISAYLSEGRRCCKGGNVDCKEQPLILERNVLRSAVLNNKTLKIKVIRPNQSCMQSTELKHMDEHLRICKNQLIECPYLPIGCNEGILSRDAIQSHMNMEMLTHKQLLTEWVDYFKNEIDTNTLGTESLKGDLLRRIDVQKREIDSIKVEGIERQRRIEVQKNELNFVKAGLVEKGNRISTLERESVNFKRRIDVQMREIYSIKEEGLERQRLIEVQKNELNFVKAGLVGKGNRIATLERESVNFKNLVMLNGISVIIICVAFAFIIGMKMKV